MATATHGGRTATMDWATPEQAIIWQQYEASRAVLRRELDAVGFAGMTGAVDTARLACLQDLYEQLEVVWAAAGPVVVWS